jgi:hypothetical protein
MDSALITSPAGVMTVLVAVVSFWFWLEKRSRWKLFEYLPPLIFIYATPVVLSNTGLIPYQNGAYDFLRHYGLPIFICLMLIKVDVVGAVRIMGKGVLVMLLGSVGVVLGGFLAFALGQAITTPANWPLHFPLPADSWKAFGSLAGSWIGGTGNMTAAHAALEGGAEHLTMAAAADQMVYLVWLPLLLGSRAFARQFNRWMRVPSDRLALMDQAAADHAVEPRAPTMTQLLYLALVAIGFTWISLELSDMLPPVAIGGATVISASTWLILLVTTSAPDRDGHHLRVRREDRRHHGSEQRQPGDHGRFRIDGLCLDRCPRPVHPRRSLAVPRRRAYPRHRVGREHRGGRVRSDRRRPSPRVPGAGFHPDGDDRLCSRQLPGHPDRATGAVAGNLR